MRRRRRRQPQIGLPPGTLTTDPEAQPTKVSLLSFGLDTLAEHEGVQVSSLPQLREQAKGNIVWVNVEGLRDTAILREIGSVFRLHPLTLEDVVHVRQRPKVEDYEHYQYIVLRNVILQAEQPAYTVQMSLIVGDTFVISFHEQRDALFASVRERLRKANPRLRQSGSAYLAYSLIDALIDTYFPVLEALGERTEALQEEALFSPSSGTAGDINQLRRDLLDLRRAIWPLRDEMSRLLRAPRFAAGEANTYLRDVLDHSLVLIDLLESLREIGASLMDLYLSSMSNRMNEVMKWLTIVSTIFIPLTFIAGIYGMNFNPETSPLNMPELTSYYGYPIALFAMLLTGACTTFFIWRKGWFRPMVELQKTDTSPTFNMVPPSSLQSASTPSQPVGSEKTNLQARMAAHAGEQPPHR